MDEKIYKKIRKAVPHSALQQIGSVDIGMLEIIELIHSYPLAADFASWITEGKFKYKALKEGMEQGKYAKIIQFSLGDEVFFNGLVDFYLDKLDTEVVQIVTGKYRPIFSGNPYIDKIKKVNISKVVADPYYTIISHIYSKDEQAGNCWEIYNLRALVNIYNQKQDPLRYWRRDGF